MSETETTTAAAPRKAGTGRIVLARVLTVIGVLLAVVSLLSNFVRREALDTDTFEQTARELIANDVVRDQVAATVVDELYANVDVAAELEQNLPPDYQGLAGPIAGFSRQLADRAAAELLERPRVQQVWVRPATLAHEQLIHVLEGGGPVLTTEGGAVVLDLRPLVVQVGDQVAIAGRLAERLPEDTGRIEVIESDQLELAQDVTQLLKAVANWIWLPALLAWAGAVWLAAGRRRLEVRAVALGLIVVGLVVIVVRALAGSYFVENLVESDSVRPAASEVWRIVTDSLAAAAWTTAFVGLVALLGVWFVGPGRRAGSSREALAPYLRRADVAFGAWAVAVLLFLWLAPVGNVRVTLVVLALSLVGLEVVRRTTAREHPDAVTTDLLASVRGLGRREGRTEPAAPAPPAAASRLAALHGQGALTDEEFAREKQRLLAGP